MMARTTTFGHSNRGVQMETNYGTINQFKNHADPLDNLPTALGAGLESYIDQHEDECLTGTRTHLLHNIAEWAVSPHGKCIFWLNGMAGTGKSTISRTVGRSLRNDNVVVSFFFKRGEGDRGNAIKFFPTISRQLACCIPDLAASLREALSIDPDIPLRSLREQFNKLLLQPLQSLEQASSQIPTIVLVIDALDECDNDNDISYLLQLLPQVQKLSALRLRIFLTSRPEFPIRLGVSKMANHEHQDLALHEIPEEVTAHDISLFLQDRFKRIQDTKKVPANWPGEDVIRALVEMSVPLFISAATVCRFIEVKLNPVKCLADLINDQAKYATRMEKTYLPVLMRLLHGQEEDEDELLRLFQKTIGLIILLAIPLSVNALSRLFELETGVVTNLLDQFQSVLSLPSDQNLPVRIFHLSFRDFLLQTRNKFSVDEKHTHKEIMGHCLTSMSATLKKNICDLESYGTKRAGINSALVSQCLQPELYYSCRYWVYHLEQCTDQTQMVNLAFPFLEKHFLHWVAMSLLGVISEVVRMIDVLQNMAQNNHQSPIVAFLRHAKRFVLKNHQIINERPLQLYCAGLVFAPTTANIRQRFQAELPAWIGLLPQVEEEWSAELQTLEGHSEAVESVAFSPDGRLLASASNDRTVRLWDPATGAVQQTLKGHSDRVHSVAFSPDGRLLASATYDGTVWLWDPNIGVLQKILKGHSDAVSLVTFSPNSQLLVSASFDGVVRLWDPATGSVQQTLKSNSIAVRSVAFSPDGWLLASATYDCTVRLWDLATGAVQQTLESYSDTVGSVAFSPDGQLLALASDKGTVRLWDPATGAVQQTLKGHSDRVHSVAFSPDSRLLASASYDMTVRLWDPATGTVQQTLKGHSDKVRSVAFSPDGRLLVSASDDHSVRLWDPTINIVQQTLEGHLAAVRSVAFSPDGRLLASAHKDRTVRLWDPVTGTVQQMLEGHPLRGPAIHSVAFSPDGRLLASACYHETLLLWDLVTGVLQGTYNGSEIKFSRDGSHLKTDSGILHVRSKRDTFVADLPQMSLQVSIDPNNWITLRNKEVLWLPPEYRSKCFTVHGNILAIGHTSGRVSFVGFQIG